MTQSHTDSMHRHMIFSFGSPRQINSGLMRGPLAEGEMQGEFLYSRLWSNFCFKACNLGEYFQEKWCIYPRKDIDIFGIGTLRKDETYVFFPQMAPWYQFLQVLKYFFLVPKICWRAQTFGLEDREEKKVSVLMTMSFSYFQVRWFRKKS